MFLNPWLLNIWLACVRFVEKVFWGAQGLKKNVLLDIICFVSLHFFQIYWISTCNNFLNSNLLNIWVCNYVFWVGIDQDNLNLKNGVNKDLSRYPRLIYFPVNRGVLPSFQGQESTKQEIAILCPNKSQILLILL